METNDKLKSIISNPSKQAALRCCTARRVNIIFPRQQFNITHTPRTAYGSVAFTTKERPQMRQSFWPASLIKHWEFRGHVVSPFHGIPTSRHSGNPIPPTKSIAATQGHAMSVPFQGGCHTFGACRIACQYKFPESYNKHGEINFRNLCFRLSS